MPDTAERFWSKVRLMPDGCLLWAGSLTPYGYGNFTGYIDGVRTITAAHRWAWYFEHGYFPERPMVLDHVCRNRWCVSTAHLDEVTQQVNLRRGHDYRKNFSEVADA